MNKEPPFAKNVLKKGRIINNMNMNGHFQMAADAMMLEKLTQNTDISLAIRFYTWTGSWLSIGHNQKNLPKHWTNLVKEKKLNIVRRPSGGGAVLHSGGLTYSLAWKSPPKGKHQSYLKTSEWLINCFKLIGIQLKFGIDPINSISKNCFSSSSPADLIDSEGFKRIGSAQYWRKGNVLQHGEILLDPPSSLWEEVFKTTPPKPASKIIPRLGLEDLLIKALKEYWSEITWMKEDFQNNELEEINQSTNHYMLNLSNSDF